MTVALWKAYASPLLRARSDNPFSHLAQRHMLSTLATWRKVPLWTNIERISRRYVIPPLACR